MPVSRNAQFFLRKKKATHISDIHYIIICVYIVHIYDSGCKWLKKIIIFASLWSVIFNPNTDSDEGVLIIVHHMLPPVGQVWVPAIHINLSRLQTYSALKTWTFKEQTPHWWNPKNFKACVFRDSISHCVLVAGVCVCVWVCFVSRFLPSPRWTQVIIIWLINCGALKMEGGTTSTALCLNTEAVPVCCVTLSSRQNGGFATFSGRRLMGSPFVLALITLCCDIFLVNWMSFCLQLSVFGWMNYFPI